MSFDSWTEQELWDQIQRILPPNTVAACFEGETSFIVRILPKGSDNEDELNQEDVIWEDYRLTYRDALFALFQHLWAPAEESLGPWVAKNRPSLQEVAQNISEKYADPGDLDPEEIAAVYDPLTRK